MRREGEHLVAAFRNDLTDGTVEMETDQIIVERGTFPVDEVYLGLKEKSVNQGVTDIDALLKVESQPYQLTDKSDYLLYLVGDAVSSRSLHAALLDAFRIAVAL